MKILFLGTLFEKSMEQAILEKSKVGIQSQVNKFQWALINGFDSILDKNIDIINVLPVGTFPNQYKSIYLKKRKWQHCEGANNVELSSINLPFIKQLSRSRNCKKEIKKWIKRNHGDQLLIIVYTTYLPFLKAIYKLDKKIKVTIIVTDIPEYDDLSNSNKHPIRRLLRNIQNKIIYKLLERIDSFVLLTEQMKVPLKVNGRPYVVVEGIYETNYQSFSNDSIDVSDSNKKIILYTGTLHYQYGIKNLLEAFQLINNSNYELWICGSGEAEKEIKQLSKTNNNIKFFGYLLSDKIKEFQSKATILVNPRQNEGEYTKYSFPSKTMEYLASGKPVLMYKLDGIPKEYDGYVFYFDGDKPKDMASKIIEVCEKADNERLSFGMKARKFILEEKNHITQVNKVIKLLNDK